MARSYQQENQRSEENQKTPNVYSSQTFDSASKLIYYITQYDALFHLVLSLIDYKEIELNFMLFYLQVLV